MKKIKKVKKIVVKKVKAKVKSAKKANRPAMSDSARKELIEKFIQEIRSI